MSERGEREDKNFMTYSHGEVRRGGGGGGEEEDFFLVHYFSVFL